MYPSDVGPDWDPREDDADVRRDPLYKKLVASLRPFRLGGDDLLHLYYFLHAARTELLVAHQVATFGGSEAEYDTADACQKLRESAEAISKQLDYFRQLHPLDSFLFEAFKSKCCPASGEARRSERQARNKWEAFRSRLQVDAAFLAAIAKESLPALASQRQKVGRPSKVERDRRFMALVQSLDTTASSSRSNQTDVAWTAWQTCFDEMEVANEKSVQSTRAAAMRVRSAAIGKAMSIRSLDAAVKIVQQESRRDRQGQKVQFDTQFLPSKRR